MHLDPRKDNWIYDGIQVYAMMKYIDVLVDGEFKIELKDTKLLWKGSSNQRVINVQETLKRSDPLVPVLHCGNYN